MGESDKKELVDQEDQLIDVNPDEEGAEGSEESSEEPDSQEVEIILAGEDGNA